MKLRALLELCRISNLPTVWSNAVLGYFAGAQVFGMVRPNSPWGGRQSSRDLIEAITHEPWNALLLIVMLSVPFSLLYSGGMILNDYIDRGVDAEERPGRPIPSGRVRAKTALRLSVIALLVGVFGVWLFENSFYWFEYAPWRATAFAAVLALAIVSYNVTHQRTARSVLLMGLCRGLVVISAASVKQPPAMEAAWWLFVAGPAVTLIVYTALISIVARREMEGNRFAGTKTIMNMIAAMPLLDAVWLAAMGLWPVSLFCIACAGMTKLAHRKVAGS